LVLAEQPNHWAALLFVAAGWRQGEHMSDWTNIIALSTGRVPLASAARGRDFWSRRDLRHIERQN
jgi:hypothetical protein